MDFDRAICKTGYGKFHFEITFACAISVLSVGFQNGLSAYVFPAAQCDLKLTSSQIGFLNVSFLVGGTLSAFLWGVLADKWGRRKVLILTHLLNGFITVICAVNQYVLTLMICRFLNGFLIGGPGSIIFSYFAEFQPPKYRASSVCYCGLFFTSSWLLLPVIAWAVLPLDVNYTLSPVFTMTSWRLFYIILTMAEFVAGFWFIRLPESPKFHMAKGETKEALTILKHMFAVNTKSEPEDFPVKYLTEDIHLDKIEGSGAVGRGKVVRIVCDVFNQIKSLFKPPLLFLTILTCSIMFTNMLGVFGLGLWLPELFIRFEEFYILHPNESVTIRQLASLTKVKNETLDCGSSFDTSVIINTVAMGITSLVVSAISGFMASKVKLKTIPFIAMLLGGISSGSIYWLTSSVQNLVVSCIFQATMVSANMAIGGAVVELFPTQVSGIAICLVMCMGRVGAVISNMMFGLYMDSKCEIPIFVVAANVLLGAGLCWLIPNKPKFRDSLSNSYADGKAIEISVIEPKTDGSGDATN